MPNREDLKAWIRNVLLELPVTRSSYFINLWRDKRITVPDNNELDELDRIGSKLACTALDKKILTLFCLPDSNIYRRSAIFATILIKYAMEGMGVGGTKKRIVYFGTTIKFKYAIESTYVGGLPLSDAFPYTQSLSRKSGVTQSKSGVQDSTYLPEVICIYNPSDIAEVMQKYKPDIVVVDCGREQEINWLDPLLSICRKKNIPGIGWQSNPFSKLAEVFESNDGSSFYFPNGDPANRARGLAELYLVQSSNKVTPVILDGLDCKELDTYFSEAKKLLNELVKLIERPAQKDTVKLFWKCFRIMESLTIPLAIYNTEAKSYWGIYSLDEYMLSMQKSVQLFVNEKSKWSDLIQTCYSLGRVIEKKIAESCPIWQYLCNLCMDRSEADRLRVVLFQNRSQKQLFSYTLLSKANITEDELLNDSRILLRTFNEFTNPPDIDVDFYKGNSIDPIVVGLPDLYNKDFFSKVLKFDPRLVLFRHQLSNLKALLINFNKLEKEHLRKTIKTIKRLSAREDDVNVPAKIGPYSINEEIEVIHLEKQAVKGTEKSQIGTLTRIGHLEAELNILFATGIEDRESELTKIEINDSGHPDRQVMVEKAIKINFEEGFFILVAEDEKVNLIKAGKIEALFVRSVRLKDKLLVIHSKSRESLYDLIISRIHTHPSLEIHMALLRKWREEFFKKYLLWKNQGEKRNLNEFLCLLQDKGSDITSTLAVNNWLDGTTLRPNDEMDIYRIGEVLGINFFTDNYKKIAKAASRVSGIHIALSRKLNNWLQGNVMGSSNEDMEILDEEVGLTVGDLRSSIKILTVKSIESVAQTTMMRDLGTLEKSI